MVVLGVGNLYQAFVIAVKRSSLLWKTRRWCFKLLTKRLHKFSIGVKSELQLGQTKMFTLRFLNHTATLMVLLAIPKFHAICLWDTPFCARVTTFTLLKYEIGGISTYILTQKFKSQKLSIIKISKTYVIA